MKPDELIKTFENDKDLLIVIYLRTLEQEKNIDYNGIFFSVISRIIPPKLTFWPSNSSSG